MKGKSFFFLCCVSLIFTFASAYPVDARAPKTEKIVFSSNRRGNWDIYVMNPDGKQSSPTHQQAKEIDFSPVWSPTQVSKFSSSLIASGVEGSLCNRCRWSSRSTESV